MGTALRRCRDAEIVWEERTELDLAQPETRREFRGWGLRVNLEGRLGWAWGDIGETPEVLLDRAVQMARHSQTEGILFSHGLPFTGQATPPDPVDLRPHFDRLTRFVGRLQFLVPSLVPDRAVKIHANLRIQQMMLMTRAGEQISQRVTYNVDIQAPEGPPLSSGLLAGRLRESPSEILCQLAWRAAHGDQLADPPLGTMPAVWTEAASAAVLRDLVTTHFDAGTFASKPELAAPWGETWLSPQLTIQDDGTLPSGPGTVPFDGEGLGRKPVSLVQEGVVHHHLADRLHAKALGVGAPGLAVRDWGQPPRPGWSNLTITPGGSSLGDLARRVSDGVILDRLVPCEAPREDGEFCRLAEIAFRLKGGRPVERLAPVLVRGRFTDLLGEDLLGLGAERSWSGRCFTPPMATGRVTLEKAPDESELPEPPGAWW